MAGIGIGISPYMSALRSKGAKPPADTSLTVVPISNTALRLTWDLPAEPTISKVLVYGSPDGVSWVVDRTLGAVTTVDIDLGSNNSFRYFYLILEDIEGHKSGRGVTKRGIIIDFMDKIQLWTSKEDQTDNYYVNKIGVQDRESIVEDGVYGVIHPGRAISYDASKGQHSSTVVNIPPTLELNTNSLSISFDIKIEEAPSDFSFVMGIFPSAASGTYNFQLTSTGTLMFVCRSSAAKILYSTYSICDGKWHKIVGIIDKSGNMSLYIDKYLQGTPIDMFGFTFDHIERPFLLSQATGPTVVKQVKDIKIYPRALSDFDVMNIFNNSYVGGLAAWWGCQEGKENDSYALHDISGNANHMSNYGFDSSSLVTGNWDSLLNKYGYSILDYESPDLIMGDGTFSDADLWTQKDTNLIVSGGQLVFNNNNASWIINNRSISYTKADRLKCSFDMSASGTISFLDETNSIIYPGEAISAGHHDITFAPLRNGTQIRIYAKKEGAFNMDNFTVTKVDNNIISPLIDSAAPTLDIYGRLMVFHGEAKHNLLKVGETIVKMTDNDGDLFNATEKITVNDWYSANGVGNEISLSNIELYQTGRQYYKNEELIIIKNNQTLNIEEDSVLKEYMAISSQAMKYRAGVCLSFDGCVIGSLDSWINYEGQLRQYGWRATFGLTTPASNTTEQQDINYITSLKLQYLDPLLAQGHELANHSLRSYNFDAALASGKTRQEYYDGWISPLNQIVHDVVGIDIVTHFYHGWYGSDDAMDAIILENGFVNVRRNLFEKPEGASFWTTCYSGLSQKIPSVDNNRTLATRITDEQLIEILDYARDNDVILNIFSHVIVENITNIHQITIHQLELLCKYIYENNMTFYKYSELIPSVFGL